MPLLRKKATTESHPGRPVPPRLAPILLVALLTTSGCSIKGMAMNGLANALSAGDGDEGSNVYLTDNDPILVGDALPFSLKLMETVLQETPEHEGLLVATATGFVSYAEMWVLRPSKYLEDTDYRAARAERMRAKALFLRAKEYAGQALDLRHPGIVSRLTRSPEDAVEELSAEDLSAMYWYTAALGRAITTDLGDAGLLVQGRTVRALLDRANHLDPTWNKGAIHEFFMVLPSQLGGSPEKTEEHYAIAMELNGGSSVGPMVALAESAYVTRQERDKFTAVLTEVLEFDPDQYPENRLTNILAQQHAAWLLSKTDELFWMDSRDQVRHPHKTKMRVPWPLKF
jgi:hypothetical protein